MKPNFYGWKLITALFVIYSSTTVSTNCLSLFYPKLREIFGWTPKEVVGPASMYFLYIALISPFIGFVLGKIKPKALIISGIVLAFVVTLWFANLNTLTELHLIFFCFAVAIAGSGLMPSMAIIANWFHKKRGLATGIFLIGSSFGGILLPQIARYFISNYDWRVAAYAVAFSALLLGLVPWFFLVNTPTEIGQTRDGAGEQLGETSRTNSENYAFQISVLFKSPVFYILIFITASFWFCGFGVLQNLILYLTDEHFDLTKASIVQSLFAVFSIIGKVGFGYLSDKYAKANILILATFSLIIGIICLRLVSINPIFAYYFAVIYGVGYSGAFAMIQLTVAEFYREQVFSKVLGIVNAIDSVGGFLGVFLMAKLRTDSGSYALPINLLIFVCTIAFIFSFALKKIINLNNSSHNPS